MTFKTFTLASAAILALATTASAGPLPSDFDALDADKNGTLSFAEYRVHANAIGLSTTEAAQDFTRAAQGDASLTRDELNLASVLIDDPYALQAFTTPPALPVVETIEEAPIAASTMMVVETPPVESETHDETETVKPEMVEPDSMETETPEPIITDIPLEDVAGEVEVTEIETPAEEGFDDMKETPEEEPLSTDGVDMPETEKPESEDPQG